VKQQTLHYIGNSWISL